MLYGDGMVRLAERVYFFRELYRNEGDVVVDGEICYCDKAKYPRGERLGIRRCVNGFYLDRICLKVAA